MVVFSIYQFLGLVKDPYLMGLIQLVYLRTIGSIFPQDNPNIYEWLYGFVTYGVKAEVTALGTIWAQIEATYFHINSRPNLLGNNRNQQ